MIYATDPNATAVAEPSQRPYETVIPLAARLGLTPEIAYAVGREAELASTIAGQEGVFLVAWEHNAITRSLLPAIANGQSLSNMPKKWDEARYDIVLRFDRASLEVPWTFSQLFPVCFREIPIARYADKRGLSNGPYESAFSLRQTFDDPGRIRPGSSEKLAQ